ncbi:ABC transporter substrate-binding protein [Duganella sp. Leaf126]|uniref:substrate-binding periplasmic protein n=1 Tax=Duganella sp. Leaf126 TaxID=1736266 RepID=UPI00138F8665|nr:transporter substrate-binding domain-containing protein [Duganella sp. Leaf126]
MVVTRPAVAVERLAVGATFRQLFEQDAEGRPTGLAVDVLRALAARAGDTVRFQFYPWPRAQAMVERGQADILIGPYRSAERLTRFDFLDQPFYRDRLVFYARRQGGATWRGDFGSLAGLRVAAVRGWHYGAQFDAARQTFELSEVPQVDNGLRMLALGRVDLFAGNRPHTETLVRELGLAQSVTALCPDIGYIDSYLAFPRAAKFAAARRQYNGLLGQMIGSGELRRLGAKNGLQVPGAEPPPGEGECR